MPLEGEQLDELLSCYLDGQLSDQELRSVQQTLAESPAARVRLQELSDVASCLRDYFGEVACHADSQAGLGRGSVAADEGQPASSQLPAKQTAGLGPDFAARVIAEAQRRAVQAGLPDSHHVRLAEQAAIVDLASGHRSQRKRWRTSAVVAIAASLLLLVSVPLLLSGNRENGSPDLATAPDTQRDNSLAADDAAARQPDRQTDAPGQPPEPGMDSSRNNPFELADTSNSKSANESSESMNTGDGSAASSNADPQATSNARYVSEIQFGTLEYVVVVNVLLSKTGDRALQGLLTDAGIGRDAPIVVGSEFEKAIAEARMIVTPRESGSEAVIYLIRADVPQLGRLLEGIYADSDHFPEVAFDLAVDDPQVRLLEKIASSTGQRFAVDERFAAPVAMSVDDANGSPFAGWQRPTVLVSSKERSQGPRGLSIGPESQGHINSVLLIVRSVE